MRGWLLRCLRLVLVRLRLVLHRWARSRHAGPRVCHLLTLLRCCLMCRSMSGLRLRGMRPLT